MKRVIQNFQVNPDTLAQEVIAAAAAGEDYVTSPHTLRHLRAGELFIPDLAFDDLWDEWTNQGGRDIHQRAKEHVERLLGLPPEKQLSPEIDREFTRIMASARKNLVR